MKLPSSLIKISIESIHQWSQKWLIKFNPDKTEIMTISKKHHKPHHPPVYMDNVIIKEFETHKHLGLTISEDGNWNEHVENIMIKVSSRLSVFRRVKFKLKRSHSQTIYISFITPLMEYGDIVWDNIPYYLKQSLESLQLEFLLAFLFFNNFIAAHSKIMDTVAITSSSIVYSI